MMHPLERPARCRVCTLASLSFGVKEMLLRIKIGPLIYVPCCNVCVLPLEIQYYCLFVLFIYDLLVGREKAHIRASPVGASNLASKLNMSCTYLRCATVVKYNYNVQIFTPKTCKSCTSIIQIVRSRNK